MVGIVYTLGYVQYLVLAGTYFSYIDIGLFEIQSQH